MPVGTGANRKFLELELIDRDFTLSWRDIEASRKLGLPLELGPAAVASAACARKEDRMILDGLLKAANRKVTLGDWSEAGSAFASIVEATEKLVSDDSYGAYAVVLSPALYARTQRVAKEMGRLESKLIKDIAKGGLFRSPILDADQGLVVSLGAYNFDLAVAQDLIVAYVGNEGPDHLYRVIESLVLRVKRPGAICKLEK